MTCKSRTLSTIAVATIAVGAVLATLSAQPPAGRGQGRGPGPGGRGGPGGPMPILRQLDLTESQREQIKGIHEEQRQGNPPMAQLAELQQALNAALFADTPDIAKIEELKAAISNAEVTALASRIAIDLRVAQVLTPEQRTQARELMARRPGRGRGPNAEKPARSRW